MFFGDDQIAWCPPEDVHPFTGTAFDALPPKLLTAITKRREAAANKKNSGSAKIAAAIDLAEKEVLDSAAARQAEVLSPGSI